MSPELLPGRAAMPWTIPAPDQSQIFPLLQKGAESTSTGSCEHTDRRASLTRSSNDPPGMAGMAPVLSFLGLPENRGKTELRA